MEDRVAEILAQRSAMEHGTVAALAVSIIAHAGVSALAVWAAWHHTTAQIPTVMNIRFAKVPQIVREEPPKAAPAPLVAEPAKPVTPIKPVEPPKPQAKPIVESTFGRSTKKPTEAPPAPAPATTTQPEIAVGAAGVTGLEGGDFPYTIYIDRMKTLIGTHWFRPQVAGSTTTVYFSVNRDGAIRDAKVETPSGNSTFDRAALRAVLESSPLPPLPFGYSGTYLGVHLTFR